jgi:N-acetylmuramoyl-L-alanine amidase
MQEVGKMTTLRLGGTAILAIVTALLCADGRRALSEGRGQKTSAPQVCQRSDFRVVIDVGHTEAVPGAMSAHGVPEYTFNLNLAQDVKQALVSAGFDKTVLLITSKAPFLGLFERAIRANAMAANLFISIHHDSVPDYLLQTWQYEGQEHHFNDDYPGYAIFISNENGDRAGSLQFGKFLGTELQARGLGYTPHYILPIMRHRRRELLDAEAGVYRYDELIVLRRTQMPAALLEAGPIINRQEEPVLASPERRAVTSAAIAAAVEDFCRARATRHNERLAKRPSTPAVAALPHRAAALPSPVQLKAPSDRMNSH